MCVELMITTTSGPAFVANAIKIALRMLGIKKKVCCVYHPQSQGVVKHAENLKAKLATIRAVNLIWVDALQLELMSM